MKLYTQEQVKEMIDDAHNSIDGYYDIFKKHTPIELPSDEEIHEESDNYVDNDHVLFVTNSRNSKRYGFSDGAKWMRNKILNK